MTQVQPATIESVKSETAVAHQQHPAQTPIDRFLHKLSRLELPAKEHLESYLRHKWRLNHKRSTLQGSFAAVRLFLELYGKSGKTDLKEIERADLEAFIEHVQDAGFKISTVRTKQACLIAFLHFLIEQDVICGSVLKRPIKLKLPEVLPRAMNPTDVQKLLSVINDIRDRALILLLLRT